MITDRQTDRLDPST